MTDTILITGAAGFIGSTLSERLVDAGHTIVGVDNFCDFYPRSDKQANLQKLHSSDRFELAEADIRDRGAMFDLFTRHEPHAVIHIAAMAGVRPSIAQPHYYTSVNLDGTVNLLDAAVHTDVGRFVFASSSSVYGNNSKVPFAEDDPVDFPISPYAATKRSGELICHTYWHLYRLPIFCLRFFTVFGPRQRPDLAISKFLRLVHDHRPIPFFGDGSNSRDYTYIDDIVNGIVAARDRCDRFAIYNLGGSSPVTLDELVGTIERVTGRTAKLDRQPVQPGDVNRTWADLTRSKAELGYEPKVPLEEGIARQWAWMQQQ
jgi:UDP-glucuronate 4-epimerase